MRIPAWPGYSEDQTTRRRQIRAQIRGKARYMEEKSSATARERNQILFGRRNAHRRTSGEYERPDKVHRFATWDTARSIDLNDPRGFEARPLTWIGVRGSRYCDPTQWSYPPNEWVETWGELVPEPFNRHDSSAVAIDLDGIRLGYAPAGYARYAHTCVCALNSRGFRVLVPLRYRSDYFSDLNLLIAGAYAALPTFGEFDKLLPTDEECVQLLQPLWEALDDSAREQISRDRFGLTDQTLPYLIALRHLAPEVGLPSIPRLSAVTYQVDRFVKAKQAAWHRQRDDKIAAAYRDGWRKADISRLHGVSYTVISRVLKEAGIDSRVPRVSPEQRRVRSQIVAMLERGVSRREISDTLGVSHYVIAAAAKDAGVTVPSRARVTDHSSTKMHERLETCRLAVRLQAEGSSRAEIAQQLGVSEATAKIYLADGRFFENPKVNTDRLDRARALRKSGATKSQLVSSADRRGLRDANMLDLIGKPWR